ncbi:hypothetical protein WJX73_000682 [Symbiochloris irregularis]|uniref:Uncharacterized protein n=1 Tax=Symbiochloris irregularis TaxID=706552 RepID=A0AAW1NZ48_9CHLO
MILSLFLDGSGAQRRCKGKGQACSCITDVVSRHAHKQIVGPSRRPQRFKSSDRTDQDRWRIRAAAEEAEDDEIDFAVLRITLGIPGFDERQLPRVVAFLCLSLLFANRFLSPGLSTPSQGRVEALAVFLAAACFAVPTLGRRLADARAGRTQASNSGLASGTQLFEIAPSVSQSTKQELAWASSTLLRNTGKEPRTTSC